METDFIYLGGQAVACVEGTAPTYLLTDWQGSAMFDLDALGQITRKSGWFGYARSEEGSRSEIPGYTGAATDQETGQTYLGARYLYHQRFTSPDPAPLNPAPLSSDRSWWVIRARRDPSNPRSRCPSRRELPH